MIYIEIVIIFREFVQGVTFKKNYDIRPIFMVPKTP